MGLGESCPEGMCGLPPHILHTPSEPSQAPFACRGRSLQRLLQPQCVTLPSKLKQRYAPPNRNPAFPPPGPGVSHPCHHPHRAPQGSLRPRQAAGALQALPVERVGHGQGAAWLGGGRQSAMLNRPHLRAHGVAPRFGTVAVVVNVGHYEDPWSSVSGAVSRCGLVLAWLVDGRHCALLVALLVALCIHKCWLGCLLGMVAFCSRLQQVWVCGSDSGLAYSYGMAAYGCAATLCPQVMTQGPLAAGQSGVSIDTSVQVGCQHVPITWPTATEARETGCSCMDDPIHDPPHCAGS